MEEYEYECAEEGERGKVELRGTARFGELGSFPLFYT